MNSVMQFKMVATGAAHLLTKRYLGPFWSIRKWLAKTQWYSGQELETLQLDLWNDLVRHCYNTVPFYRNSMQQLGISPEREQTREDINSFPILKKQDIIDAGESIVSQKYPEWFLRKAKTGGTTGTSLALYRNLAAIGAEHAFIRRQFDWAGLGFQDRSAYMIAGRKIADPNQEDDLTSIYDPFMKELTLSVYHLNRHAADHYTKQMKHYNIRGLVGIASVVFYFARLVLELKLNIPLKAVLTTSEILTPEMRHVISEAFQCPVYDYYGAAERVCYIFTCEKGSYHINPEYGITQLIPCDQQDPGVYKIVATGFWNKAMPLIRYDTGDVVRIDNQKTSCSCGRSFPVVESIGGRENDTLVTPSGKKYGPTIIARVVKTCKYILASQVIQDTLDHVIMLYVPAPSHEQECLVDLKNAFAKYLSNELQVEYKKVEKIPKTDQGKTRLIVSKLKGSNE